MVDTSGDIFAGDFKASPYWWDAAAPLICTPDLPEEADLVIVGAGFCGLGAARRALELGVTPVVLDAGPISGGASSRSGAMLSGGQKFLINGTADQLGAELLGALTAAHAEAFDYVQRLAGSGSLGEVLQRSGRLFLAAVPKDLARFAGHARIMSELAGVSARVLGPDDVRQEIDTRHYHGGLLVEAFGGLHPSKFAVALAQDLQQRGAILRSHTKVRAARRDGDRFLVRTSAGDVRARHVLFATNAYTDDAMASVRRRLAPVGSYMIATEAIGREAVDALMPARRMYSDSKRNLWYFRPSPDGERILFGARPGLVPGSPERAAPLLHRFLTRVFPSLAEVRISHAWTGAVAMTRSHLQHIGQRGGCWFAVGCNGSGVGIMPWLGHLAVERMLGTRTTPTVFERLPFGWLPNLAGRPWYVPVAAGAFGFMDWLDRRQAGL
ncbi:NAD(P)/FAD-dependent oxidoreductase [Chelatococcus asaccharovorans]|uniref:Glycine/D-amino acid oxidase-like deaminating enzyme n=1 Tax=Chelatococcus asaccharovorans TaxID=28210 RepID=A0A2V3UGH5_9HYPH|nr:FAD-binding oxidoreductase [Chelatococcus asaccharovorans]MBS7701820.1 FAD-binding oxidoreductase [Chelatococcus asaccharovorans]PXW64472.1 glycine/D-amino acid oxidase-like deaminating enzyme [Chelatococcus asaccharovorans]